MGICGEQTLFTRFLFLHEPCDMIDFALSFSCTYSRILCVDSLRNLHPFDSRKLHFLKCVYVCCSFEKESFVSRYDLHREVHGASNKS